ncbi:hypothetical protein [Fusobacterium sp.]|uniref:Uncharacterized protein n=1 Tax=Fusobacterium nucleatum TaxID=851 RepID=A0A323TVE9_FUSNU|nr:MULTISPECIES: hypothetical protein [Fusobacterium]PCR85678.1 hypothetical protein CQA79_03185 [Fusobacterium nucleatum]PZA04541.1 hypothetical protein DNF10_05555 [Fusobacterium nucleatum]QJX49625.1 hypothetical protein HOO60_01570 [Fusobacterium nucleatum]HCE32924.1 hypothetical protein [Fusobacterium sp.]
MWRCKKCGEEVGLRRGILVKLNSNKETTGDDLSMYDTDYYECSHCHIHSYSDVEEIADWEED